jgi:hypothetical protein
MRAALAVVSWPAGHSVGNSVIRGRNPGRSMMPRKRKEGRMLLIGESLNVISTKIGRAFKERDPKPIQEEALFQKEKGWITSTSTWDRPKKTATS